MAYVTFRNIPDENTEFTYIDAKTLAGCVREYARQQSDDLYSLIMREYIVIRVDDEIIPPDEWMFKVVDDDSKIIITPRLSGGDAFGIFEIFAGAALMAFAWINPFSWPALATQIIFSIGFSFALGGLSYLLFAPDLPALPEFRGGRSSQTYSWSGIRTIAQVDTPIPVVYGTHAVGGNIISVYTEQEGEDQYLNMLLALCEGEIEGICKQGNRDEVCVTSDQSDPNYSPPAIKIDDQWLSDYKDIQWWYRTGTNKPDATKDQYYPFAQNEIPYFDAIRVQYDDGRTITSVDDGGVEYTTTTEVDFMVVNVTAPALYTTTSSGIYSRSIEYKVEFREESETEWTLVEEKKYKVSVECYKKDEYNNTISISSNWIDVSLVSDTQPGEEKEIIIRKNTYFDAIAKANPKYGGESWSWEIEFSVRDVKSGLTRVYTQYNSSAYITNRRYWYRYDHQYGSVVVGNYKIQIKDFNCKIGYIVNISTTEDPDYSSEWHIIKGKSRNPVWKTTKINLSDYGKSRGIYKIRISRKNEESDDMMVADKIILNSVIEGTDGTLIYPNTALLGLRIRANEQLSGSPPSNIVTFVKGKKIQVPDIKSGGESVTPFSDYYWGDSAQVWKDKNDNTATWDETSWRTEHSNLAILCVRDLLLNERYGLGLYVTESDIKASGIIECIKECAKKYDLYEVGYDLTDWWKNGSDSEFLRKLETKVFLDELIFKGYDYDLTIDKTNRFIKLTPPDVSFKGGEILWTIRLQLNRSLIPNSDYTLTITFDNPLHSNNALIKIYCVSPISSEIKQFIRDTTYNFNDSDKKISVSFTPKTPSIYVDLDVKLWGGCYPTYIKIENINITLTKSKVIQYHTFDGVIDSRQNALTTLLEMCNSFRCWPVWYEGKFNFVIDKDDTPTQIISVGNSLAFSQTFTPISEIPYRLIGQFTDEDEEYQMKSLVAIAPSNVGLLETTEQTVGLKGITNRRKAERELKFKLNKMLNCTHTINLKVAQDMFHQTAGGLIIVQDDLPQWGQGGRLLSYDSSNKKLVLDKSYTFSDVTQTYVVRYQTADNSYVTATIDLTGVSDGDSLQEITLTDWSNDPNDHAPYIIGVQNNAGKTFRVVSAMRDGIENVELTCIEHISSVYSDDSSITVYEDRKSELPDALKKPKPPQISVEQLSKTKGFIVKWTNYNDDLSVKDVTIKLAKRDPSDSIDEPYKTIMLLTPDKPYGKYESDDLEFADTYEHNYVIEARARNNYKVSDPTYVTFGLQKTAMEIEPPSGVRVKGQDSNVHEFQGKDLILEWNSPTDKHVYYQVEIYHTEISRSNLLHSSFIQSPTITYSFEKMIEDSDGKIYGTKDRPYIFRIFSLYQGVVRSGTPSIFRVWNSLPSRPTNLTAESTVGGVIFRWTKSAEKDHKHYEYQIKVGSGSWTDWAKIEDNTYTYTLTPDDITQYGRQAEVFIRVRDKDWYDQVSDYIQISQRANLVSDDIFQISAMITRADSSTGDASDVVDGITTSGGIYIA